MRIIDYSKIIVTKQDIFLYSIVGGRECSAGSPENEVLAINAIEQCLKINFFVVGYANSEMTIIVPATCLSGNCKLPMQVADGKYYCTVCRSTKEIE